MREESHLDDMRAAIRGDFERLAERRGNQELMREVEEPAEEKPERLALVPPEAEADEETEAAPSVSAEVERESSWLARLLGR
jgi:hypothetical protein